MRKLVNSIFTMLLLCISLFAGQTQEMLEEYNHNLTLIKENKNKDAVELLKSRNAEIDLYFKNKLKQERMAKYTISFKEVSSELIESKTVTGYVFIFPGNRKVTKTFNRYNEIYKVSLEGPDASNFDYRIGSNANNLEVEQTNDGIFIKHSGDFNPKNITVEFIDKNDPEFKILSSFTLRSSKEKEIDYGNIVECARIGDIDVQGYEEDNNRVILLLVIGLIFGSVFSLIAIVTSNANEKEDADPNFKPSVSQAQNSVLSKRGKRYNAKRYSLEDSKDMELTVVE